MEMPSSSIEQKSQTILVEMAISTPYMIFYTSLMTIHDTEWRRKKNLFQISAIFFDMHNALFFGDGDSGSIRFQTP